MKIVIFIKCVFFSDFKKVEIIVTCSKSTEDLSGYNVTATDVSLPYLIIRIFYNSYFKCQYL